jgi:hypothetical protein
MLVLPCHMRGASMSRAQRISRGFHRLAILLAAIPLLIGGSWALVTGFNRAGDASRDHQKVLCAHEYLTRARDQPKPNYKLLFAPDSELLNLKEIGCSYYEHDTVSFGEAWNPPQFNWPSVLAPTLAFNLAVVLAVSLGVYGVIRAIGWVIGGFAA